MATRVVFTAKDRVEIEHLDVSAPKDDEVLVRTLYSLVSTGTEQTCLRRRFDPGTHWDAWVRYPFRPGYACVGEVVSAGSAVSSLKAGDIVVHRQGHASAHVLTSDDCYPVPTGIDPAQAVWFAIAEITMIGALTADYGLGDEVLVIGAGPIGQMSLRWAAAAGVDPIIVLDPMVTRHPYALAGGATHVLGLPVADAAEPASQILGGRLPRIVLDSTGNPKVMPGAMAIAGLRGRIVVMGDTGFPASQHMTPELITKCLTISGAWDGQYIGDWNDRAIKRLFFSLLGQGRMSLEGLNTHVFAPADAVHAYDITDQQRDQTMGVLFDWTREAQPV